MADEDQYLLGHGPVEWSRLTEQHALWGPRLLDDLRRAGVGLGSRVLEVGCGAADLLCDLVALTGRAEGLEQDPAAVRTARQRLGERAEVRQGDLMQDELGGPFDAVVARWVLSFLPQPSEAVRRMATALTPGGVLVIHDYNHDALGVWPRHPDIDGAIEAFRAAYRARGGDLWIAARLPAMLAQAGLQVEAVTPHAAAGPPGGDVWRWVERFLLEHLHTVIEGGQLSAAQADAFRAAWQQRREQPGTVLFSPLQVTVVGRLPQAPASRAVAR
ncbi:MAG: methyltransferase domain-containing protein [Myxococcales bacterium]|nr:methyltransferase domain-containing protein [Myxococcales bacterium]